MKIWENSHQRMWFLVPTLCWRFSWNSQIPFLGWNKAKIETKTIKFYKKEYKLSFYLYYIIPTTF